MLNLPLNAAHCFALRGVSSIRNHQKTFYISIFQVPLGVPMDYRPSPGKPWKRICDIRVIERTSCMYDIGKQNWPSVELFIYYSIIINGASLLMYIWKPEGVCRHSVVG